MKKSLSTEAEHQTRYTRFDSKRSTETEQALGFIDNRATSAAQRQLITAINASPRNMAQRKEAASLHTSLRMAAQRKWYGSISNSAVQLQSAPEDELLQGRFETAQRMEEEEPLQGKFETLQRMEEEESIQGKFSAPPIQLEETTADKPNNTGLPDNLKAGIETLSGISMDNVKVHYNSEKPAQLNALAYAQGTDIHVAPGQEKHLPHEGWHVVQQAQGRVQPTMQMKEDVPINDDQSLEQEADVMGEKAASQTPIQRMNGVIQLERYITNKTDTIHLHLDIGKGDHLMIGAARYNLMGKSDYSQSRLQEALEALQQRDPGRTYEACHAWLESQID